MDVQESVLFLKDCFYKSLYCGHKGKEYIIKVIIIAKKLLLDSFKYIKDSLGEV